MTLIDTSSSPRGAEHALDLGIEPGAGAVTDTSELRWFVDGDLPPDVMSWFTRDGTVGLAEERCDTYRLDGRFDTGVKRRFREKLELKERRSIGDRVVLGRGLAGRLEVWRRWSPAELLGEASENATWADVHKIVIKRRFAPDGSEVPMTEESRAPIGTGCDVEIAGVRLDDTEAWTFAFAAYGPLANRCDVLVASWLALLAEGSPPDRFGPFSERSRGYPEWLADVTSRTTEVSSRDVRLP